MEDGQINQEGSDALGDFHGIRVKFEDGNRVHLLILFNRAFTQYPSDDFNSSPLGILKKDVAAETLFHEMKLHIDFDPLELLDANQQHIVGGLGAPNSFYSIGDESQFYLNREHYCSRTGISADDVDPNDTKFLSTNLEVAVSHLKEYWETVPNFNSEYLSESKTREEGLYAYLRELLKF